MSNGLVIEPTEMKFAAPYTRHVPVHLRLENSTTDQVIAFKVKAVEPRRYTAKPSNGVIAPQSSTNLTVELQPLADDAAIDKFVKTKQKFMIQSVTSSVESASESVATMFASGGQIVETKLECVFEGQSQANTEKSHSYKPVKSTAQVDDLNEPVSSNLVSTLSSTGGTAESTASAVQGTPQVNSITTAVKPRPASVSVSQDQSGLIIALLAIIIVMLAIILAFK